MLHFFGEQECETSLFGDKRLDKRLAKVLQGFTERPSTGVCQAFPEHYEFKGCYRFWSNKKVQPEKILESAIKETLSQCTKEQEILAIQDTSSLDFTNLKSTSGLGYLESGHQFGIKLHTCMAVSTSGLPLGILWQQQWERPIEELGKRKLRKDKPIHSKESQRWIECHNEVNALFSLNTRDSSCKIIHITDREGDIYEYFAADRGENNILLRFVQDRRIDGEYRRIKQLLDSQPSMGIFSTLIGRRGLEYPKEVTLEVKYSKVKILSPANIKNASKPSIELTAIQVYEVLDSTDVNRTADTIEWYLLTSLPVNSVSDAQRCVKYYTMRWLIERFHYVLKSGCNIEKLQLEQVTRLENAVASFSLVSWRILYLTYLSRISPDIEASAVLSNTEVQVLKLHLKKQKKEVKFLSLLMATMLIAQLGGFLCRKSDGSPGVKTLWRGLLALEYLCLGYEIAKQELSNMLIE